MTGLIRRTFIQYLAYVVLSILVALTEGGVTYAQSDRAPEPNPPRIVLETTDDSDEGLRVFSTQPADPAWKAPAAATEWIYHKTIDNLHPDGNEQQMMWLTNRARANPTQEGVWLATMPNSDVAAARSYFGVNLDLLRSEFAALPVKPPAAFDVRLYNAAKAHSEELIRTNAQNHTGQLERVDATGFARLAWAGIVFSYSHNAVYGHAAFNIDWGPTSDGTGMQLDRGHREAIMSVSGNYTNVGYAVVPASSPPSSVGPQVITGNFCSANTATANHFNRFIVGTVWEDTNSNGQYDPGEGLAGVTVMPDKGTYFAVTANSGGYAIPMTAAETYTVTFSGGELIGTYPRSVTVATSSVLLDLEYYAASSSTPPPVGGDGGGGGGGGGGGCFIRAVHPPEGLLGFLVFAGPGLLGLLMLQRRARR